MVAESIPLIGSRPSAGRVLLVGDTVGVPRVLRHLSAERACAIVAAEIRPHQHRAIAKVAAEHGIPFLVQPRSSSPGYAEFIEAVAGLGPDLILCDSYSMLLRPELLRLARGGAVNVHGGLLPRYRGANPIQWMLVNDEAEAGVTIHYMDGGFDSGDVIARRSVEVRFTDTWREIMTRIHAATEALLAEFLPSILAGTAHATPQDSSEARSFPHRKPADGAIEWSRSVREIYNLVRALVSPLPGAFYTAGASTVVLDEFLPIDEVALLKQRMIGGSWTMPGGARLAVQPHAPDGHIRLHLLDGGGQVLGRADLSDLDFLARKASIALAIDAPTASASGNSQEMRADVEEFARRELGIRTFESGQGVP